LYVAQLLWGRGIQDAKTLNLAQQGVTLIVTCDTGSTNLEEINYAHGLGIDIVDVKVTSTKQPQSSCPFKSARQKIYGLGYSLLIFVYEKLDNSIDKTARLRMINTIFVDANKTADFQMSRGIRNILDNQGNKDDLIAFFIDRNLPVDEIQAHNLADEILINPPQQGFLTISNALQWRLQYTRVIELAGYEQGLINLYGNL
jgi:hypothetical protein